MTNLIRTNFLKVAFGPDKKTPYMIALAICALKCFRILRRSSDDDMSGRQKTKKAEIAQKLPWWSVTRVETWSCTLKEKKPNANNGTKKKARDERVPSHLYPRSSSLLLDLRLYLCTRPGFAKEPPPLSLSLSQKYVPQKQTFLSEAAGVTSRKTPV